MLLKAKKSRLKTYIPMPRKTRTVLTCEKYNIIIRMAEVENIKIKDISAALNICRHTVTKALKWHLSGRPFISCINKYNTSVERRNSIFNLTEQTLFNTVACNNSIIQKEIKQNVQDAIGVTISQSTISRKL